jgi:hypothetical protein
MRKARGPVLVTIGIFCAVVALAFSKDSVWKEYVYAEDGFAISAPAKPKLEKKMLGRVGGEVEAHFYYFPVKDSYLLITCFPLHPSDQRAPQQVLNDEKESAVPKLGSLVSENSISLGGYPGIEIEAQTVPMHSRVRYYAVGRRMYMLMAVAPREKPFPAELQRWSESFRLVGEQK